jgi:uncharacterized protein YjbI with pentapeptide repeats
MMGDIVGNVFEKQLCGRPLHAGSRDIEGNPACLMHSCDPNKSVERFQEEFDRIILEAGEGPADFNGFVFPSSDYPGRSFIAKCRFTDTIFCQKAGFFRAVFAQQADFTRARFDKGALFGATFSQGASFVGARFMQSAHFGHCTFVGRANFRYSRFADAAQFEETRFVRESQASKEPAPIFCQAVFEKPERVIFYQTNLGYALFHNCDISGVNFSDVVWCRRANGKCMCFEEMIDPQQWRLNPPPIPEELLSPVSRQRFLSERWEHFTHGAPMSLQPGEGDPNPRNYRLVAELYQRLKKNYDARCDYWTAGDFHYGEMEMKRLASPRRNRLLRWLHSHLGLVAWYKYASEYGESFIRPTLWLSFVFLFFTFLYPLVGLHSNADSGGTPTTGRTWVGREVSGSLTYLHPLQDRDSQDARAISRARLDLLMNSGLTSLEVALLQRNPTYEPSYRRGRLLMLLEQIATSTLVALFLLAVRRQFKR